MKLSPKITIVDHFKDLEDKRVERTKRHKLIDIGNLYKNVEEIFKEAIAKEMN
ncbi:hypothetical protein [Trichormus sp. NMC-1]|uniref:hypothetical protein n=1 Tax=Trichormus sp. NMC-1 TaxID=1853259 RepID=UPI000A6CF125|nr:hypothetical protein [Trichormus sp. NMC-1]